MPSAQHAALDLLASDQRGNVDSRYLEWQERSTRAKAPRISWLERQRGTRLTSPEATSMGTTLRSITVQRPASTTSVGTSRSCSELSMAPAGHGQPVSPGGPVATGPFGGPGDWIRKGGRQKSLHSKDWSWCVARGDSERPGTVEQETMMLRKLTASSVSLPTLPANPDAVPAGHVVPFNTFTRRSRVKAKDFANESHQARTAYR